MRKTLQPPGGLALIAGALVLSQAHSTGAAEAEASVPVNTWKKVVTDSRGSGYQPLVYDTKRQCIVQFNVTDLGWRHHQKLLGFRRFDSERLAWVDEEKPRKVPDSAHAGRRIYNMGFYYPKTGQIIYGDGGAYDTGSGAWTNLDFKVELYGNQYPGGPPQWWGAMCYDTVNDELVSFSGAGARNFDDYEATGFVGGSLGTMTLSFKDRIWRRLKPHSDHFKKGRALLRDTWWEEGKVVEKAWRSELERAWNPGLHKQVTAEAADIQAKVLAGVEARLQQVTALCSGLGEAEEKARLELAVDAMTKAVSEMKATGELLGSGKSYEGYLSAFGIVQKLRSLDRFKVRVEPPARMNSPMAYDPASKSIVVFGGHHGDGLWNDTWIYDCRTRKWRESKSELRPPARQQHFLVHHSKSGKILMGGGNTGAWQYMIQDLWAYDIAADKWSPVAVTPDKKTRGQMRFMSAYDPKADLIVVHSGFHQSTKGVTWVIRPDLSKPGTAKGAAAWSPPLPKPFPVPDDPEVLAKLKSLPANTWVDSKCKGRAPQKDWGSIGYDPSSGFALLFGGGHSTYQGDDITVYMPGANCWIYSHKPNNAAILPQYRNCMGGGIPGHTFQGGSWTHHQRNTYEGAAGEVLHMLMVALKHPYGPPEALAWTKRGKTRYGSWWNSFWEYDLDRRMWRTLFPQGAEGRGQVFPADGKIIGLLGGNGWRSYDPVTGRIAAYEAKSKLPNRSGEGRHFAYIPDRHQLLLVSNSPKAPTKTYLYDLATGEVKDLAPKNSPPAAGRIANVLYMPDQDCAWARISSGKGQWLYSFAKNTWVEAPFGNPPHKRAFTGPYGKEIYSAKYKVLICGNGTPTYLLRPDMSKVEWE